MKRFLNISALNIVNVLAIALVLSISGCSEHTGPEIVEVHGPPGPQGEQGPQGEDGMNGENGEQGEPGIDGIECAVDPNTLTMQYEWVQAEAYRQNCTDTNDANYQICLLDAELTYNSCVDATGTDAEPGTGCMAVADGKMQDCEEYYNEQNDSCHNWYAKRVNKIPLRVCGVRIFGNEGGELPYDENGYQYMNVNEEDFDGDGISNWMEFWMGLNPCTPWSFGQCIDDADLDYDADGIPNGEDEAPICPKDFKDKGEYLSDCV